MTSWLAGPQKRKIIYQTCQLRRRNKKQLPINTEFVQRQVMELIVTPLQLHLL